MLEAERASRGMARVWAPFESYFEDTQGATQQLYAQLKALHAPVSAPSTEAVNQFISPTLRHHRASEAELAAQTDMPKAPQAVMQALRALAKRDHDPAVFATLDEIARQFEAVSATAALFWRKERALERRLQAAEQELTLLRAKDAAPVGKARSCANGLNGAGDPATASVAALTAGLEHSLETAGRRLQSLQAQLTAMQRRPV